MNNSIDGNETTPEDRKSMALIVHVIYFILLASIFAIGYSNDNESILPIIITFTVIAAIGAYLANGLMELYKIIGIIVIVSFVFNFVATKEILQRNKLEDSYSNLLYENKNYANTENAKKIRTALESYSPESYKIAFNAIKKRNQNKSQDIDNVLNLVSAIKNITPELTPELKLAMADNFVSIEEYTLLKDQAIKNISSKKLTTEQLVLLGSIK